VDRNHCGNAISADSTTVHCILSSSRARLCSAEGHFVFVGANSTILMNTKIGNDVIIGAGSLVTKDIPDDCVVAGVPAKVIGKTSEYIAREKEKMNKGLCYDKTYSYYQNVSMEKKKEMQRAFEEKPQIGYLELGFYKD